MWYNVIPCIAIQCNAIIWSVPDGQECNAMQYAGRLRVQCPRTASSMLPLRMFTRKSPQQLLCNTVQLPTFKKTFPAAQLRVVTQCNILCRKPEHTLCWNIVLKNPPLASIWVKNLAICLHALRNTWLKQKWKFRSYSNYLRSWKTGSDVVACK